MNPEDKVKTPEDISDEKYPATDYSKKAFSFSATELDEIKPLVNAIGLVNTFLALGEIAQRAKDGYVGGQVLDRLGVKKSPDSHFIYDTGKNRIVVYEPRQWCSVCGIKKAEFKYQDKIYCKDCIEAVKQEMAKKAEENIEQAPTPVEKVEEKKEPKKKK